MEYTGKLYGRIGNKHFDTGHTAKDWDELNKQIETLKEQLKQEQKLPVDFVSGTGAVCEKTSLKILEWLKSDNCWITDKEGNKLPDADNMW